eukprot:TRINITY_DN6809_c0_g1_i1.p1 TRINITY_DN6809_c0_g1~~TRINITY_DN6809_c0_g1_i1.p1  ORF type:complete len:1222 (-),score=388.18 TRINITY_DN6809_c0_g1_i1:37-3702(-)
MDNKRIKDENDSRNKGKAAREDTEPLLGKHKKEEERKKKESPKKDRKDKKNGDKDEEEAIDYRVDISDPSKNESDKKANKIKTSKYNLVTFLPKNLFNQFKRIANIYFLVIMVLSSFPFSPVSPVTTAVPLFLVLAVTAVKDGIEDIKRHKADREINTKSKTRILKGDKFEKIPWEDVRDGDIIKVKGEEEVPADLILISASGEDGKAFVETSNLDGETNLKTRQALEELKDVKDENSIKSWKEKNVFIECEQPNNNLDKFTGRITVDGKQYPLSLKQMLLRGCTLMDTDWAYGMVVYTGHDTKIMKNSSTPPFKRSRLEKQVNSALIWQFVFGFIIVGIGATYSTMWEKLAGVHHWYLDFEGSEFGLVMVILNSVGTFVVLFSMIIPISLYVTIELVRLFLAYYMNNDLNMVDEKGNPSHVRSSSLVEELGQIDYIFSDKTGTLTVNVMNFRAATINGKIYGDMEADDSPAMTPKQDSKSVEMARRKKRMEAKKKQDKERKKQQKKQEKSEKKKDGKTEKNSTRRDDIAVDEDDENDYDEKEIFQFDDDSLLEDMKNNGNSGKSEGTENPIREWLTVLSVCHSTMPQKDTEGEKDEVKYQATSPDEKALIVAAKQLGFVFHTRQKDEVIVNIEDEDVTFKILSTLEFSSDRKRMSVICKDSEGKLKLYCKGADSVVLEMLREDQEELKKQTKKDLKKFAEKGLRTLAMAYRELEEEEFNSWNEKYQKALVSLENREEEIDKVSEEIEKDLILLGGTGIEDKLQDRAPETLARLKDTGIKLWVLTGDKKETAVNIGYSCSLFTSETTLITLDAEEESQNEEQIKKALEDIGEDSEKEGEREDENEKKSFGLVLEGKTLDLCLSEKTIDDFLKIGKKCDSVIICRISPLQKSKVVESIKNSDKKKTVLAIGDGANDVAMIHSADIGVGIIGKEGSQAVRAADFAIGEFKSLERLLLIHGRWAYKRIAKLVLYFFYKNVTFAMTQFWFNMLYSQGSGQSIFDSWSLALYNALFTAFPVVCYAIFEQDLPEKLILKNPGLYADGPKRKEFSNRLFLLWVLDGIYQSFIIFMGISLVFRDGVLDTDGLDYGLWSMGLMTYIVVLVTVTLKIASETTFYTRFSWIAMISSVAAWFLWMLLLCSLPASKLPTWISGGISVMYKLCFFLFQTAPFWLSLVVIPVMALWPHFTYRHIRRLYFPRNCDVILESQRTKVHRDAEYRLVMNS